MQTQPTPLVRLRAQDTLRRPSPGSDPGCRPGRGGAPGSWVEPGERSGLSLESGERSGSSLDQDRPSDSSLILSLSKDERDPIPAGPSLTARQPRALGMLAGAPAG